LSGKEIRKAPPRKKRRYDWYLPLQEKSIGTSILQKDGDTKCSRWERREKREEGDADLILNGKA